jgi:hypothetical protein
MSEPTPTPTEQLEKTVDQLKVQVLNNQIDRDRALAKLHFAAISLATELEQAQADLAVERALKEEHRKNAQHFARQRNRRRAENRQLRYAGEAMAVCLQVWHGHYDVQPDDDMEAIRAWRKLNPPKEETRE